MLKFLFGGKKSTPEVVIENDRARFQRLVRELNELIDTLAQKPPITVDPATGHVLPEEPEHFADEALALPAPDAAQAQADTDTPNGGAPDGEDADAEPGAEARAEGGAAGDKPGAKAS